MIDYLIETIWGNWVSGGIVMIPLFALAAYIFVIAFEMLKYLKAKRIDTDQEDLWLEWVNNPDSAEGSAGEVIRYTRPWQGSADSVRRRFFEVRESTLADVERKSKFLASLVATAPLMGLLGTVQGMLITFQGIASSGGNQTVDMVSKGISTALITTQTGLMIALPGLFLALIVRRRTRAIQDALNRMEGLIIGSRIEE